MTAMVGPHDTRVAPPRDPAAATRPEPARRAVHWQVELLAAAVVAVVYLAAPSSVPSDEVVRAAEGRGAAVFELERAWSLDVEPALQRALAAIDLQVVANWLYGSLHFVVTFAAFVSLLRRRPDLYARWRTAFVVASVSAFLLQRWLPVAPPRLVPSGGGSMLMSDWLAEHHSLWSFQSGPISDAANHYAAMPSMHVGWAMLSACALAVGRTGMWRRVALAYPVLVAVVVMATGNHFLLDVVAGAALAAAALAVVGVAGRLRRRSTEVDLGRPERANRSGPVERSSELEPDALAARRR